MALHVKGACAEYAVLVAACASAERLTVVLQASSPDEEALVQGAAYLGYKLLERTTEHIVVEVHGQPLKYLLAATLEFNSDRKRMSIIVQTPDKTMLLMCKGADSIILARLSANEPGLSVVQAHLVGAYLLGPTDTAAGCRCSRSQAHPGPGLIDAATAPI